MYLIGFSFGPVVLSPIAEDYGRKWVFTAGLVLLYALHIPIALAPTYATLPICRFLAGFVAAPIFNVRLIIRDLLLSLTSSVVCRTVVLLRTRFMADNRRRSSTLRIKCLGSVRRAHHSCSNLGILYHTQTWLEVSERLARIRGISA